MHAFERSDTQPKGEANKRRFKLELGVNSSALIRVYLRLIFYQFEAQDGIRPSY